MTNNSFNNAIDEAQHGDDPDNGEDGWQFALGETVETITGFAGYVEGRAEYMQRADMYFVHHEGGREWFYATDIYPVTIN